MGASWCRRRDGRSRAAARSRTVRRIPSPKPGSNARGNYVSVFVEYSYDPILKSMLGLEFIPSITMNAESTLVINT